MGDREIRLKSKDGIKQFLKTVVEMSSVEAVKSMDTAHSTMREREKQQRVAQNIQAAIGSGARSSDKEKDEADDDLFADDGDSGKDEPKKKPKPDADKGGEAEPKAEKKPEPSSGDGDTEGEKKQRAQREPGLPKYMSHDLPAAEDVTLDMVIDRLNVMRSGKSLKDENVAVEMQHYFDDLSSPERLTLLSLLTGLAEVITGGKPGEEATDPEEAGVSTDAPEGEKHAPEPQHKEQPKQQAQAPQVKRSGGSGEDVTPPIRVGGAQNTESIRRKMRTLT